MGALEDSFRELARSMDAMMEGVMGQDYFRSTARDSWDPALNVYETAEKLVVCVELAGIHPGDLDVQVDRGVLHIRGRRLKPVVPEASGEISVHLMEINSGKFHRKVSIAPDLDVDACSASYKNGYVWIVLPRRAADTHGAEDHA
jgi:HSP20 family protein